MSNKDEQDLRSTDEVIRDLKRNFATRRLLLVSLHVLIPSLLLAASSLVTANQALPGYQRIAEHSIELAALMIAICSILICHSMARCHWGILLNGSVINIRLYNYSERGTLNPLCLSAAFYFLASASALLGFFIFSHRPIFFLIEGMLSPPLPTGSLLAVFVGFFLALILLILFWHYFRTLHSRAIGELEGLTDTPENTEENIEKQRQLHRMNSLDDTDNDIAVVVVTAVAMFSAILTVMASTSGINHVIVGIEWQASLEKGVIPGLALFGMIVLGLSLRMLMRLRLALAEHSSMLVNREGRRSLVTWDAQLFERTRMLYLLLGVMFFILTSIAVEYFDQARIEYHLAIWVGGLFFLNHFYDLNLKREREVFTTRFSNILHKPSA